MELQHAGGNELAGGKDLSSCRVYPDNICIQAATCGELTWVEKMLQEHHLTSAPSAVRVSISTAVWMVMWREPAILAPLNGCEAPNSVLQSIVRPFDS